MFGPINYGYRLGILGMPARFLSAAAPLGFALLIDRPGRHVLLVSAALSLSACAAPLSVAPAEGCRRALHAD